MFTRAASAAVVLALGASRSGAQQFLQPGTLERPPGDVSSFVVAPDGLRTVYSLAPQNATSAGLRLFGTHTTGGHARVALARNVHDFQPCLPLPACAVLDPYLDVTEDSSRVVYHTSTPIGRLLFSVPIVGGPRAQLAFEPIAAFRVSSSTNRAVYQLEDVAGGRLLSAPVDGGQLPVQLSAQGHSLVQLEQSFALTPDGAHAVYTTGTGLFVVPVDGSAAPLQLAAPHPETVVEVRVDPTGERALYFVRDAVAFDFDLYSVPIDGSAAPVRLNPLLAPGLSVLTYSLGFTPDGSRVLYRADQAVDFKVELFSVPVDGSAAPVRVNQALSATADVNDFRIDPQGVRVLFTVGLPGGPTELFAAPVAGGTAPVQVSGPSVPNGSVAGATEGWFRISDDGARVAYVADHDTDETFELYGAPADGSGPVVKLSGTMVAGGDVSQALFNSAPPFWIIGSRVAYVADANVDQVRELFSAPLDGSAAPVLLSAAPIPGGDVAFDIAPAAGGRVLFRADARTDELFELFSVPLDGSAAPERLSLPRGSTE